MSCSVSFKYSVVRSARRTISVKVCDDNSLIVRCPYGAGKSAIERFLSQKGGWINAVMAKNSAVMAQFEDVINYKTVLVCGREYKLFVGQKNGVADGCVSVRKLGDLKKVLVENFGDVFLDRVRAFAAENNFAVSSVAFKSYRGRWGCCDRNSNIVFNYKLLMLPVALQDAVICHELCHTRVHSHSAAFHGLLDRVMPDNAVRFRAFGRYDFIARLY